MVSSLAAALPIDLGISGSCGNLPLSSRKVYPLIYLTQGVAGSIGNETVVLILITDLIALRHTLIQAVDRTA